MNFLVKPTEERVDGMLNPEIITYNRQIIGYYHLLMTLYKLDIHGTRYFNQDKDMGYPPKLIVTDIPYYRVKVDYTVPAKKFTYYRG